MPTKDWDFECDAADRTRRYTVAAAALLLAFVAASWAGSLDASFQFDDWNVIVDDIRVRSLTAWWHSLPAIRPALKLTYALGNTLGGSPRGFRIFNIAVHWLNAVLVFGITFRRAVAMHAAAWSSATNVRFRTAFFIAFTCSGIFALEPVQTEAVTYICGRSSSLAALPCLIAVWCWDVTAQGRGNGRLHGAGIACYALALAIKETAIVLPLLLFLWHSTRPAGDGSDDPDEPASRSGVVIAARWSATERRALAGYGAVALVTLVLALDSGTYRHLLGVSLATRSIASNLELQTHAWGFLAGELFRLSALDADPSLSQFQVGALGALLWAAPWLLVCGLAWLRRARAPALTLGIGWFVICLLPTNTLLPRLDIANDRQLYLALVGPAWLAARALGRMHRIRPALTWLLVMILLAVLGAATAKRNQVYRTEVAFWQNVLRRSPGDGRAANDLGIALALACRERDAAAAFARAIALDPADYRARVNLELLQRHSLVKPEGPACILAGLH